MSAQCVWVPSDVFRKADTLLRGTSSGAAVKEGVELLLKSDLTVGGENPGPGPGRVDASGLLAKGLAALQNNPHEALGIPVGAKTQEIRKAYKKAALLYHPDKNPKTTPLFQAIQLACDKLSDKDTRAQAEEAAAASNKSTPRPAPGAAAAAAAQAAAQAAASSRAYQQDQHQQHYPKKQQVPPKAPVRQEPPPQPRKESGYDRYRSASTSENTHDGAGLGRAQQDYRKQHNEAAEEAKKRAVQASVASNKFEADERAKEIAEKRAADLRAAAMREAAAQKQRDRDEILKEGQKEYFDEQAKLRQAKLEKERAAAEAFVANRRAMYSGAPTATPDGPQGPQGPQGTQGGQGQGVQSSSYQNKNTPVDASNIRGFKQSVARPPASSFSGPSCVKPTNTAAPTDYYRHQEPQPTGGPTFQANSDGKVRAQYADNNKDNYNKDKPMQKKKAIVPVPVEFKYVTVSDSAVELEWKISIHTTTAVLIQLSWRRQIATASWQSATRLINGLKCKKNNLELSPLGGSIYEFRVRAIEDLPGGMLGDRSEWTDTLLVHTYKPKAAAPIVPTVSKAKVEQKVYEKPEKQEKYDKYDRYEDKPDNKTENKAENKTYPSSVPPSAQSSQKIPTVVPQSQYNYVYDRPEQFKTKATNANNIPAATNTSSTADSSSSFSSGSSSSSSAIPSKPTANGYNFPPTSSSFPSSSFSSTTSSSTAASSSLPPTATAKSSQYQYPSYIYKEGKPDPLGNNPSNNPNFNPNSGPNFNPNPPRETIPVREDYTPYSTAPLSARSSSSQSAKTTATAESMRRHSSFQRPSFILQKEKNLNQRAKENNSNDSNNSDIKLGVNMSDVDECDLSVDDIVDDDGSSDDSESESFTGSGSNVIPPFSQQFSQNNNSNNSKNELNQTAKDKIIGEQENEFEKMFRMQNNGKNNTGTNGNNGNNGTKNMGKNDVNNSSNKQNTLHSKSSSGNMNMSFTRTAWEGINIVLPTIPSGSTTARSNMSNNTANNAANAKNAINASSDDDDEYSEDLEVEVEDEDSILSHDGSVLSVTRSDDDEEIVEDEGSTPSPKQRKKSAKYSINKTVINKMNSNGSKHDLDKITKDDKKTLSPSHRIRQKYDTTKKPTTTLTPKLTKLPTTNNNTNTHQTNTQTNTTTTHRKIELGKSLDDKPGEIWFELIPPKGILEFEHTVLEEPIQGSEIMGLLIPGMSVLSQAVVGSWAKVRYHKKAKVKSRSNVRLGGKRTDGWGWCLINDQKTKHVYLESFQVEDEEIEDEEELSSSNDTTHTPDNIGKIDQNNMTEKYHRNDRNELKDQKNGILPLNIDNKNIKNNISYSSTESTPDKNDKNNNKNDNKNDKRDKNDSKTDTKSDNKMPPIPIKPKIVAVEEWHERFDDEGGYSYYYNVHTGESSWEAPEWVEETDPTTGVKYYMKLNISDGVALLSTWTKPVKYARLLRRATT